MAYGSGSKGKSINGMETNWPSPKSGLTSGNTDKANCVPSMGNQDNRPEGPYKATQMGQGKMKSVETITKGK